MNPPTSSLHIVRNFGPVGGMERYVWELTHALQSLGQNVAVICEDCLETPHPDIRVTRLGVLRPKPRWLSMLRFSRSVTSAIHQMSLEDNCVIHSHERTDVHMVTSFHGPSILSRKKNLFDKFSPRLRTWEFLEKRELCSPKVNAILPNSMTVSDQLAALYPGVIDRMEPPMYPGVSSHFHPGPKRPETKTIGFIGREWRRKGLDFAARIVSPS
ncbi:MAG: glycosyltransferase [Gammaproteobacteria bacterium]|nr:glycosyltransferase [Gammaproteobacteria bacterium]